MATPVCDKDSGSPGDVTETTLLESVTKLLQGLRPADRSVDVARWREFNRVTGVLEGRGSNAGNGRLAGLVGPRSPGSDEPRDGGDRRSTTRQGCRLMRQLEDIR